MHQTSAGMKRGRKPANDQVSTLNGELDHALAIVVHVREALQNELSGPIAQKRLEIDMNFVKKLKELTGAFNSLTDCKVRLDKAKKAMEKDMTPAEERQVVVDYLAELSEPDYDAIARDVEEARA